jgi:hypothetical protein
LAAALGSVYSALRSMISAEHFLSGRPDLITAFPPATSA